METLRVNNKTAHFKSLILFYLSFPKEFGTYTASKTGCTFAFLPGTRKTPFGSLNYLKSCKLHVSAFSRFLPLPRSFIVCPFLPVIVIQNHVLKYFPLSGFKNTSPIIFYFYFFNSVIRGLQQIDPVVWIVGYVEK